MKNKALYFNGFHGDKAPLNDGRKVAGECGRSMVEMLGVLAIIGVLSVGSIAGYRYAMNKHRANEFMKDWHITMLESAEILDRAKNRKLRPYEDIYLCDADKIGDVVINESNYIMVNADGSMNGIPSYVQCAAYGGYNPNVDWNFLKYLNVEGTPVCEIEVFTNKDMYYIYSDGKKAQVYMPDSFVGIEVHRVDFEFNTDLGIHGQR